MNFKILVLAFLVALGISSSGSADDLIIRPARVTGITADQIGENSPYKEPYFVIQTSSQTGNPDLGKATAYSGAIYYGKCSPTEGDSTNSELNVHYESPSQGRDSSEIAPATEVLKLQFRSQADCYNAISKLIGDYNSATRIIREGYKDGGEFLLALYFHELPDGQVPVVKISESATSVELGSYK